MTTIAFKAGVLAFDTQTNGGGGRVHYRAEKSIARAGFIFAAAGACGESKRYLDWVKRGCVGDLPTPEADNAVFILISHDHSVWEGFQHGGWSASKATAHAWGSGAEYALGAMAFGASPIEAVEVAMRLDPHTGGRVVSCGQLRRGAA